MSIPKALQDADAIRVAVNEAKDKALANKVPLTMARLALTLNMSTFELSRALNGHKFDLDSKDEVTAEIAQALKMAVQEAETELVEHGLQKQGFFDVFLLKANHNYDDHPQSGANNNIHITFNDKDIPD